MPKRIPIPSHWRDTPFRTSDPHGLSRGRLRGRDVRAPYRGVRIVGREPASVIDRCQLFVPRMRPGDAFCSVTAALIYRMPLPRELEDDPRLHVTVPPGRQPPRVSGIAGHELTLRTGLWAAAGLPLVDPVETWLHLGSILSREDLVAVGDFLVSGRVVPGGREAPLATVDRLRDALASSPGSRGCRKLRWALERVRTGVDSRPESHLRLLLVGSGLPEPEVNQPIHSASGERLGKPDLAYRALKVLFEYEGDYHRTSAAQFRNDIRRRERFEDHGWKVVRVTSDDLYTAPLDFVARVRRILVHRASKPQ